MASRWPAPLRGDGLSPSACEDPDAWAPYAAIPLLALVVLHDLRHGDPERPWHGAMVIS
ncbi:hypothetical protein [Nonomuraea turkmeniaca]|uniref:hypothetical protein n=1 Tax=Nonomuraea turkmeniaca TaxID=103838 RepID=UPI0014776D20|nr:hypothetical protein [Nonomuraea turkmeniaca]